LQTINHIYHNIPGWFTFPGLYKQIVDIASNESYFVEVGAFMGRSTSYMAVEIINSGKKIKFDVVDTWEGSIEHELKTKEEHEWLYNSFLRNTELVKHVINPIRMISVEASKLYTDNTLDFVFIDAGHEYEDVKNDLYAWYPKIKTGGIIAGHDYFDPSDPEHGHKFPGVKKAVDEFFTTGVMSSNTEYCWFKTKT